MKPWLGVHLTSFPGEMHDAFLHQKQLPRSRIVFQLQARSPIFHHIHVIALPRRLTQIVYITEERYGCRDSFIAVWMKA